MLYATIDRDRDIRVQRSAALALEKALARVSHYEERLVWFDKEHTAAKQAVLSQATAVEKCKLDLDLLAVRSAKAQEEEQRVNQELWEQELAIKTKREAVRAAGALRRKADDQEKADLIEILAAEQKSVEIFAAKLKETKRASNICWIEDGATPDRTAADWLVFYKQSVATLIRQQEEVAAQVANEARKAVADQQRWADAVARRSAAVTALAATVGFGTDEMWATWFHLVPSSLSRAPDAQKYPNIDLSQWPSYNAPHPPNTLLALKAINGYAAEHQIRVEDAKTVLVELLAKLH